MPKNRIGFSTDFNLTNSKVGIGTTNPRATLDVVGVLKGDFNISGVTTLTSYAGFIPQKQSGDGVTITGEVNTISEDIIVNVGETFTVSSGSTISIGTLESISIGAHLSVPNGGITLRPQDPIEGTVRFNDDLNTLEFYNGVEWRQFTVTGASGRGVFSGGNNGATISTIQYVNISSTGNSQNFGVLSVSREQHQSCSSSTRGLFAGGYNPTFQNVIDYITIASEGNAIDFGYLVNGARRRMTEGGLSSSTRGVFAGGFNPALSPSTTINSIEYVTISTIGNSLDFGDLSQVTAFAAACSSPTRGVYSNPLATVSTIDTTTIEAITIASTGNSVRFGDSSVNSRGRMGCSNSTRGIFAGGNNSPTFINNIDYITISSFGNAQDFGDLTRNSQYGSSTANSIRGIFGGGYASPGASSQNIIDYITIASTGDAKDFGDLVSGLKQGAACSDSHGGLGGF